MQYNDSRRSIASTDRAVSIYRIPALLQQLNNFTISQALPSFLHRELIYTALSSGGFKSPPSLETSRINDDSVHKTCGMHVKDNVYAKLKRQCELNAESLKSLIFGNL